MRFISLFAGVGGFDLALERAGHECVYANDIDKYCKIIYDKHFTNKLDNRSIIDVPTTDIPDHELLCGGFPCQSFSIAGKRRGFEDTRGTLFFEICRILRTKRPTYLLLENVKGLLSHDVGKTFYTIIRSLDELGYDCQWQVLNSKNFGVPQNRERVFIIGHLRGTSRPKVFPIGKSSTNGIIQLNQPTHSNDRVYRAEGISPTLNTMQGGMRQPFVALTEKRTEEAKAIRREYAKKGKDFSPRRGKYLTARADDKIGALTSSRNLENIISNGLQIRRLTPVECERLQGFPDNWTEGVSDTQRYKMMGNAVTVNVVYEIAKLL